MCWAGRVIVRTAELDCEPLDAAGIDLPWFDQAPEIHRIRWPVDRPVDVDVPPVEVGSERVVEARAHRRRDSDRHLAPVGRRAHPLDADDSAGCAGQRTGRDNRDTRWIRLDHRVADADVGTADGSARREVVQPNQGLRPRDADVIRDVGDLETYDLLAHGRGARLLDRGDVIAGR